MPWPLPAGEPELLALAKSYPFETPPASYLFRDGAAHPLPDGAGNGARYAGRVPVIAHGSNRAPAQLRRKYGATAEIPVTRGWLADYDVVYSAHVTMYGAIAANLRHAPGVRAVVFVTWLNEAQLARMHETELGGENYLYGRMERIDLALEAGPAERIGEAQVYLSRRGCLADGGRPIGLAAVAAEGRGHGALDQQAALALVRDRHRPGVALDSFILRNVRDPGHRRALIGEMGAGALPAAAPHFRAGDSG